MVKNLLMLTQFQAFKNHATYLLKLLSFAGLYFIAAKLGLLLATISQSVSPFWPPTGLALAILFLNGKKYWPAITIGAFAANFLTDAPFLAVFIITLGNTLHALIGNELLKLLYRKRYIIGYHTRTLSIIVASILGALLSSTIGATALCFSGNTSWDLYLNLWFTWFTGDTLGALIFAPVFLAFSKRFSADYSQKNPRFITLAPIFLCGIFLSWLLFIRPGGSAFLFFIFPFLFWVVAKLGERGVTIATALFSLIGALSVKMGYGVFNHGTINANLLNLQLFTASVGVCSLMMADLKRNSSLKQPFVILLASWLFASLFFFGFYLRATKESNIHFQEIIEGVEPLLEAKMDLYFSFLQSGTGLFAASESVTRNEWKEFLEHGEYGKLLPGIEGVGVIFKVDKKVLPGFIQKNQIEAGDDFLYHPLPGLPSNERSLNEARSTAYVVTYMEPKEKNKLKIGLDMASEKMRREAAERAQDLGAPVISYSVALIDDPKKEPSFLIFYPFYSKGIQQENILWRRKNLVGWIFTPLKAKPFFDSLFSANNFKGISYSVSDNHYSPAFASSSDFNSLPDLHQEERTIKVGNRFFHFHFRRSNQFYSSQDTFSSWAGAVASVISLLIGTFIISLQTVKKRALELAERKTKDLKASEELWKFALEGAGDCVWDWNIPERKIYFTKKLESLLGFSEHELKNDIDEWRKRIHPEDLERVISTMEAHFKIGASYVSEYRIKCKDGHYKWILSRGMIVSRDKNDTPLRMVGTISDITERKQVEAALISQREKLMAAAKMSSLGEMAGGIAHEINNPLAIIIGKTTQLKRRLKDHEAVSLNKENEDLSIIENTAKRISSIIKGLNAFSRNAENDKMEKIQLNTLIEDTLELSRERFRFNSVALKLNIECSEKTYVTGRPSQLLQVLINLLNNAYDAVEHLDERWVEVNVSASASTCKISITDSGNGIPAPIVEKMMTPFFTTKPVGKGTGLGLSISRGIIEEHHGKLYYDQASPHTRFVIELPIA